MKFLLFIVMFMSAMVAKAENNNGLTASLVLQGGRAYPQGDLQDWITPSTTYRAKIFGGKKVDLKFIGAVGLGLDFTYTQFDLKNIDNSKDFYRRFTWDWFYIPIGLGFFHIMPGLAWVVTDVKVNEIKVKETSIRPAGILDVGATALFTDNFGLTVDARYERTALDRESYGNDEEINLTGNYFSWFGGVHLQW